MTSAAYKFICPGCGAKHSHNKLEMNCKRCGLPDEIRDLGPQVVARWKRKTLGKRRALKNERILASSGRKRNKHGRKGVQR